MAIFSPPFVIVLLIACTSIPLASAFVLPKTSTASAVKIGSSFRSPFRELTHSGIKQLPSSRAWRVAEYCGHGNLGRFQSRLRSSSTDDDEDDASAHSSEWSNSKTTDLNKLISQIETRTTNGVKHASTEKPPARPRYQLGVGKNMPVSDGPEESPTSTSAEVEEENNDDLFSALNWNVPEAIKKKEEKSKPQRQKYSMGIGKNAPLNIGISQQDNREDHANSNRMRTTTRLIPKGDDMSARLTKAVWDEGHFDDSESSIEDPIVSSPVVPVGDESSLNNIVGTVAPAAPSTSKPTITDYQQIDLSVPSSVYSLGSSMPFNSSKPVDLVWSLMRHEAYTEAAREPLLVSFLYSTILNHPTLESALAFHLANRLSSPAMLSTQIMSLIREALDADPDFRRSLRADMLAVRDRDPACNCLPDVFLYFKGFHALQTYRVAHYLWRSGRRVLAHYLQSQVSQHFQIDIHPNATLGSGIMLDHGTGIVIGETAHLGHNCSVLHHVTLGGSGAKGVDRHPKVGNGVLLGAGASVLGNIQVGDGCQVGAGTLVIEDLPPRSVAVGVPAKIIGRFVDVTAQPSIGMNQLGSKEAEEDIVMYGMDGI